MSYNSTTPNFGLPQWILSDPPQMTDFNTAFSNIDSEAVKNTTTINGKPLSSNVTLTPSDIGAQPQTAARSSLIKADSSGNLIAAVDGTDYITGETASLELQPNVQLNLAGELSNAVRAGNIVTVNFGLKVTTGFNAYQAFAYIPENLRNVNSFVRFTLCINGTPALGSVYGNGGINAAISIPANATVFGSFSYPISV